MHIRLLIDLPIHEDHGAICDSIHKVSDGPHPITGRVIFCGKAGAPVFAYPHEYEVLTNNKEKA